MILMDTDVAIDLLRGFPPAVAWLQGLGASVLGLPGLVAMELLQGCQNKAEQLKVERFCQPHPLFWPTQADCQRGLADYVAFNQSHGVGLLDVLIGHTAVGLSEPLATFNVRHYQVIAGLTTIQPY
jgi:predicted nucleic acid-binding protein